MADVVEAIAVDDGAILEETKDARARVAWLGKRSERPDLDKAKSQRQRRVERLGVLIEAGGEADRIGKIEPENLRRETGIVRRGRAPRQQPQRRDRQTMRVFGAQPAQQGGRGGAEISDHGERPEKSWFPSAPSGSGLTQATAENGNSP